MLKKIFMLAFAVCAVCALGASAASTAFAEDEFLLNEKAIGELTFIEITGELLIEDTKTTGLPAILCSVIFDGMIEPGGKMAWLEALLMLDGKLLRPDGTEGTEGDNEPDMIDCVGEKTCEAGEVNLVTLLNLPWRVEVTLDDNNQVFLAAIREEPVKIPTFVLDCATVLGLIEETCSGPTSARLDNNVNGDAIASFNQLKLLSPEDELLGAESELMNCTMGGAASGLIESDADSEAGAALITSPSGLISIS